MEEHKMVPINKRTYQLLQAAQRWEVEFEEDRIIQATSASKWKIVTEPVEKLIADGLLVRLRDKARVTKAGQQAMTDYLKNVGGPR
jgi:hypothetical protein